MTFTVRNTEAQLILKLWRQCVLFSQGISVPAKDVSDIGYASQFGRYAGDYRKEVKITENEVRYHDSTISQGACSCSMTVVFCCSACVVPQECILSFVCRDLRE